MHEKTVQLEKIDELNEQYKKFKTLLEQKGFSVSRRQNTSTTYELVTKVNSSTRYRRRHETRNVLEFIHGGKERALYGAWDYVSFSSDNQTMDKLISGFKRGKYLQGLLKKTMKDYQNSEESLKQAVLMKYQNFLSRRKYALVCKTQSSVYEICPEMHTTTNSKNGKISPTTTWRPMQMRRQEGPLVKPANLANLANLAKMANWSKSLTTSWRPMQMRGQENPLVKPANLANLAKMATWSKSPTTT